MDKKKKRKPVTRSHRNLVELLREEKGYTRAEANDELRLIYKYIEDSLLEGHDFKLGEIVTLKPVIYPPKHLKSPISGWVDVPETKGLRSKISKNFRRTMQDAKITKQ